MVGVSPEDLARVGAAAPWHLHRRGGGGYYVARTRLGKTTLLHRFIGGLEPGDPREVDHRNGDGLDNRRENLRIRTAQERGQNARKRPGTSSKFRGVHWHQHARMWEAAVQAGGERYHLGYFHSEVQAGRAAAEARARLMPFAVEARHPAPGWEPTAGAKG